MLLLRQPAPITLNRGLLFLLFALPFLKMFVYTDTVPFYFVSFTVYIYLLYIFEINDLQRPKNIISAHWSIWLTKKKTVTMNFKRKNRDIKKKDYLFYLSEFKIRSFYLCSPFKKILVCENLLKYEWILS